MSGKIQFQQTLLQYGSEPPNQQVEEFLQLEELNLLSLFILQNPWFLTLFYRKSTVFVTYVLGD